ncbi:MAG: 30S ribosomal protein S13, partial [Acidobacteria bacterium]|nr:30S ribosomal protein S13 [Acidobacteriota bacterium]
MPRIAGTDVPNDKRILISLTYIYGVGLTTSRAVLREARIDENIKTNKLNEEDIGHIAGVIDRNYVVEGQLRRQVKQNIDRLR